MNSNIERMAHANPVYNVVDGYTTQIVGTFVSIYVSRTIVDYVDNNIGEDIPTITSEEIISLSGYVNPSASGGTTLASVRSMDLSIDNMLVNVICRVTK